MPIKLKIKLGIITVRAKFQNQDPTNVTHTSYVLLGEVDGMDAGLDTGVGWLGDEDGQAVSVQVVAVGQGVHTVEAQTLHGLGREVAGAVDSYQWYAQFSSQAPKQYRKYHVI